MFGSFSIGDLSLESLQRVFESELSLSACQSKGCKIPFRSGFDSITSCLMCVVFLFFSHGFDSGWLGRIHSHSFIQESKLFSIFAHSLQEDDLRRILIRASFFMGIMVKERKQPGVHRSVLPALERERPEDQL